MTGINSEGKDSLHAVWSSPFPFPLRKVAMTPLPRGVLRSALARGWKATRRPPLGRMTGKRPGLELLEDRTAPTGIQFVDPHPDPGNLFGATILPLSTGNVVITAPNDDAGGTDAGAVYLFNGATGARISTLIGSHANDNIGSGGVVALTNGNFVIETLAWDGGLGAVTWENGTTGITGVISAANSLVGTTAGDSNNYFVKALTNGNYVVESPNWTNGSATEAGAATWGSGTSGISGPVSAANSLVGTTANDGVGNEGIVTLTNGNYVVASPFWNNGSATSVGAATWGSGTAGVIGPVSAANSLVGTTGGDEIGSSGHEPQVPPTGPSGVVALTNGNYVVGSPLWSNGSAERAGAATWGDGSTGIIGPVSAANSLVGSIAEDFVGYARHLRLDEWKLRHRQSVLERWIGRGSGCGDVGKRGDRHHGCSLHRQQSRRDDRIR